jgi:hypothetical protein
MAAGTHPAQQAQPDPDWARKVPAAALLHVGKAAATLLHRAEPPPPTHRACRDREPADPPRPRWSPPGPDLGHRDLAATPRRPAAPAPPRRHQATTSRPATRCARPPRRHSSHAPSAATTSPQDAAVAANMPRPRSHRAAVDRPHRSAPRSAPRPCELSRPAPPPPRERGRRPRRRRRPRASPSDAHWRRRGEGGEGGTSGRRRQEAPVARGSDAGA